MPTSVNVPSRPVKPRPDLTLAPGTTMELRLLPSFFEPDKPLSRVWLHQWPLFFSRQKITVICPQQTAKTLLQETEKCPACAAALKTGAWRGLLSVMDRQEHPQVLRVSTRNYKALEDLLRCHAEDDRWVRLMVGDRYDWSFKRLEQAQPVKQTMLNFLAEEWQMTAQFH
ncbi:MAG: hypothetical protein ACLQVX_14385 [Limisphaerales bacterium]